MKPTEGVEKVIVSTLRPTLKVPEMYVPVGIQWSGLQLMGYSWCCEGREEGLGLCLELTCNNIDLVSHVCVATSHVLPMETR